MKVLIVDDEAVVRIGLKSIIDWNEYGYELVGEAANGKKAMELIELTRPDIIITDIKMPVMDGLEILRQVSGLKPKPGVIVLSGYDEFSIVKEAMKLGANEYLLKLDMEPLDLLNCIEKVSEALRNTRQLEGQKARLDSHVRRNLPMLRGNLLKDIIFDFYNSKAELLETMTLLDMNLDIEHVFSMMIKVQRMNNIENLDENKLHILNFSIMNVVEEIVNESFIGFCFEVGPGEFCVILSKKDRERGRIMPQTVIHTGKRIIEMLKQYLNVTVIIGVGDGENGIAGIQEAYYCSISAVEYCFFKDNEVIMLWNEITPYSNIQERDSLLRYKDMLHSALSLLDDDKLKHIFKDIMKDLPEITANRKIVCNLTLELYFMISDFFEKHQIKVKDILVSSYKNYNELANMDTIYDVSSWLDKVLEDLSAYIKRNKSMEYPRIIAKAKKYIEENYSKELSLRDVAENMNLNPFYFSTLFKQHVGMGYSGYITQIRIEKGKELLSHTEHKVYEISKILGYQNFYYFNRIFKKIVGMTPIEYRNMDLKAK